MRAFIACVSPWLGFFRRTWSAVLMPIARENVISLRRDLKVGGRGLQTFLVLLLLKVANHLAEQGLVLGAQWLRHGGRRCLGEKGLTCAREESMCAGSGFSESELGRTTGPIRYESASTSMGLTQNGSRRLEFPYFFLVSPRIMLVRAVVSLDIICDTGIHR